MGTQSKHKDCVRLLANSSNGTTTGTSAEAHTVGDDVFKVRIASGANPFHFHIGRGNESDAIVVADATADHFQIAGDRRDIYSPGRAFDVSGSTGNDGSYTVVTSTYNPTTNRTTINVAAVPDDTDDGTITTTDLDEAAVAADDPMMPAAHAEVFIVSPGQRVYVIQNVAGAGAYSITDCE